MSKTDKEIIKALECCIKLNAEPRNNFEICKKDCPYKFNCCNREKGISVEKDILDLINRQQKTIEKLNSCVKSEDEVRAIANATIQAGIKIIKAETIKEFADRLKDVFVTIDGTFECCEIEDHIDNLVKEMVDETDV